MSATKHARWPLAIAVTALGSLSLWFALAPATEHAAEERRPATDRALAAAHSVNKEHSEAASVSARPSATVVQPQLARVTPPEPPALPVKNLLQVVGPNPDDPHEPGMLPHPLDEARARIAAENGILQSLNDAMSFRKVKQMREMLVEYRKLDPSDVDAHQLGYEVIADCIEFPGNASLSAAQEFYDTQRHSPLRRFVRRICFENSH